ncbi:MAG: hypothetical protein HZB19_04530 [Chloroflexi bacterium]|nr:hypothetical protein [Chloroflexota bacterium]
MPKKYEVDGNIFREITEKWPFAYVSEFLIKARALETDQAGNKVELMQLNDGRVFSRAVPEQQASIVPAKSHAQARMPRPVSE